MSASIKFTEKKATYKMIPLSCPCATCTERNCDESSQKKNKVCYIIIFQSKCYDQFYPVKCISVFIDFYHGEFFLLQVYLKPLCFLSSWFSKWTCCRQMERRLRQDRMGEETGAVLWRATGHSLCQGQPAGREWMNVLVKWRLFV